MMGHENGLELVDRRDLVLSIVLRLHPPIVTNSVIHDTNGRRLHQLRVFGMRHCDAAMDAAVENEIDRSIKGEGSPEERLGRMCRLGLVEQHRIGKGAQDPALANGRNWRLSHRAAGKTCEHVVEDSQEKRETLRAATSSVTKKVLLVTL